MNIFCFVCGSLFFSLTVSYLKKNDRGRPKRPVEKYGYIYGFSVDGYLLLGCYIVHNKIKTEVIK